MDCTVRQMCSRAPIASRAEAPIGTLDPEDPEDLAVLTEARPLGGVVLLNYDLASATIRVVDPLAAIRAS